jgi:DNA-binding NarL/FixJ family response regulator
LAIQQVTGADNRVRNLAPQDLELLRLILDGKRPEQIAQSLGVAEKTVANRKTFLRGKLGVTNDIELMKAAMAAGMTVG